MSTEVIYSPTAYEKKIGFVISGKCEVRRIKPDGTHVVLNILEQYDSFGVLAVFSECEEFPTEIYATKNTDILFINQKTAYKLLREYSVIAENVVRFLSERIRFLNHKIATFSGTRVENRLASFLILKSESLGEQFSLNIKKTSEAINAGRASVYRTIGAFCESGIIALEGEKIIIKDLKRLKEISK